MNTNPFEPPETAPPDEDRGLVILGVEQDCLSQARAQTPLTDMLSPTRLVLNSSCEKAGCFSLPRQLCLTSGRLTLHRLRTGRKDHSLFYAASVFGASAAVWHSDVDSNSISISGSVNQIDCHTRDGIRH